MFDTIKQSIDDRNIEVIAFDIFDTIVKREVSPEYVKKLWGAQLRKRLDYKGNFDIYELRFEIEAELCRQNYAQGNDLEFQYMELVSRLYDRLQADMSSDEFKKICVSTEINTELRTLSIIPETMDVLNGIREMDKPVMMICISDFYLPSSMLKTIFERLGIAEYFNDFFVSSDYLLTKRSGRLYDKMLQLTGYDPSKILMIGDNRASDVENAAAHGLRSVWVDSEKQHHYYKTFDHIHLNANYANHIINALVKAPQKSCFENLTFSLYSFTDLLYTKLISRNCKDVFFLSREGEFLKRIFDDYQKMNKFSGNDRINTHYLIVSRKSTFLPSLSQLEEEEFFVLFRQYRKMSLNEFLSSLNFSPEHIKDIAGLLEVNKDLKVDDFPTDPLFEQLKDLSYFKKLYEENRKLQKKNFIRYLNQFNVDYQSDGLNIVDVGWKGSIQDNIYNILENVLVYGYYLGLVALGNYSDRNQKDGILFYNVPGRTSKNFQIYNANRALFEVILGASHGSANRYIDEGGIVIPTTFREEKEALIFQKTVSPIQENIYKIYMELCNSFANTTYYYCNFAPLVDKIHTRMVLFPSKKEMDFFRSMYHYENFGVFEFTTFAEKKKLSIAGRLNNLKLFLSKPSNILNRGFWAPLTLEDYGLGFLKWPYGIYKLKRYLQIK